MIVESYEDVVKLSGAVRENFWSTIQTAVALTLQRHPSGVIIDLSGVTEMTPLGADSFRDALKFVESNEARIVVAEVPEPILHVMRQVPEVRSQLPLADTVEQARRSLDLLVKEEPEQPKRRREERQRPVRTVLVCLSGDDSDSHLLTMTLEFVDRNPSKVVMIYPIIVPRELPLNSPLSDEEERAAATLAAGQEAMAGSLAVTEIRLERARDLPSLIAETSEEVEAAQVLVGVSARQRHEEDAWHALEAVIQKVKTPLVIVRPRLG
ncbi:MAG: STAS domain-containing protein [Fimbriimonadaceae bacterium]